MDKMIEELIEVSNNYYNGLPTGMDDQSYDQLRKEVESKYPEFNLFSHLKLNGCDKTNVRHYIPYISQEFKLQFKDQAELENIFSQFSSDRFVPTVKLDGCSISAYYSDGALFDILTRSDEFSGKRKLIMLKNKVPSHVSNEVIKIDFEAVCSKEDYVDDTRSHANGLINSVYKQDEVDKNIILIPFRVYTKTQTGYIESMKLAGFDESQLPLVDTSKLSFDNRYFEYFGKHYPIDGFVFYDIDNNLCNHKIYKHYANQDIITTVRDIYWSFSDKLSWTPKIVFDRVVIDGRRVGQCSSNGLARLVQIRAGIGAEITVVLVNSTIPQVNKVITPSDEFKFPKVCPYCGSEMELNNSKFRCSNKFCPAVFKRIYYEFVMRLNLRAGLNLREDIQNLSDFKDYVSKLDADTKIKLDESINLLGGLIADSMVIDRLSNQKRLIAANQMTANVNTLINDSKFDLSAIFNGIPLTKIQWDILIDYIQIYCEMIKSFYSVFKDR